MNEFRSERNEPCSRCLQSACIYGICAILFALPLAAQTAYAPSNTPPPRGKLDAAHASGSLIGIQYEHWFYGPDSWKTAETVPLLGRYPIDEEIVGKHYEEFHELGIDWLLIDWSNMLWSKPAWELHRADTKKLEENTAVLFETALHRRQRGEYAPKLVFMLGLQNGPPVPNGVERMNDELTWLKKNFLDRPEYKDLWLYSDGKPLLTILYWPPDPCAQLPKDLAGHPLRTEDWTVRWMASQLQDNHAERCGMWSWMDGVIPQMVTRRDGKAEEVVVTPSAFQLPGRGWTAPSAIARDHGIPYLQSWKAAFNARPKFIQIHQWNEFAGQQDGDGLPDGYWDKPGSSVEVKPKSSTVYADEYNVQLSDDIEPTDLHACTMRGCGGWGFYYFNLTRAIISLYRAETPDITVLALSGPAAALPAGTRSVELHWDFLGKPPTGYSLSLDGHTVRRTLSGSTFTLETPLLPPGRHTVKLTAEGVHTYFSLDPENAAVRSAQPLPVESEITLEVGSTTKRP